MDSKLYWQENMGTHDPETVHYLFSAGEVRRLDAEKDKLLLRNIARHGDGIRQKAALRKKRAFWRVIGSLPWTVRPYRAWMPMPQSS